MLTPCSKYLPEIRVRESPRCQEDDTIAHFFLGCSPTNEFWRSLSNWCEQYLDVANFSDAELTLGVTKETKNKLINLVDLGDGKLLYPEKGTFPSDTSLIGYLPQIRTVLLQKKNYSLHE